MGKISVSNIQNFCLNDGEGIRTTIFLKGCNLHCPWCSNPECIEIENQYWFDVEKCVGEKDKACLYNSSCSKDKAISIKGKNVGKAMLACPFHALSAVAEEVSCEELKKKIKKQKDFFGNSGGITFSGGEPLLQIQEYQELLKELKSENINLCIETALFVPLKKVEIAVQYFDYFIIDMKILDSKECKKILGGEIDCYKKNLEYIDKSEVRYGIRIPLIEPYTTSKNNLLKIETLLRKYKPEKIELLRGHSFGKKKYHMLNKKMDYYSCSDEIAEYCKSFFLKDNINVNIL